MNAGWVASHRLHSTDETLTCTSVVHLELWCEDCDILRMSRSSLERVDTLYREGRLTQEDFEAYEWLHRQLSPYRGEAPVPADPDVLRIVRKLIAARPDLPPVPGMTGEAS